jgi:tRNA 2-selenouridine synthase
MPLQRSSALDILGRYDQFDTVIDARSPAEHADDHLPGAVNWPVLDDDERRIVGTIYKQDSPFEARRRGAAMVARRIADHLDNWTADLPRTWRPLVYCWRGGDRSGTLSWFLDKVGYRVTLVDGGYKAFRAAVRAQLEELPDRFDWRVLCGKTGCGKTRLLHALAAEGAQVLDLEGLAAHRGSVLGLAPGEVQPNQKRLDTLIWQRLRALDPARPVFVEGESKKLGQRWLPEALIERLRSQGRCIRVELPDAERLTLLLADYDFLVRDTEFFCRQLDALTELRGKQQVQQWQAAARAGGHPDVFAELMAQHYDPGYLRSLSNQFAGFDAAEVLELASGGEASLREAARRLMQA